MLVILHFEMTLSDITSRDAILEAIAEFSALGREAFLAKYGFGLAQNYFLLHDALYFDSKAIAGAAHGVQFPESGPLHHENFSGGEKTVAKKLRSLGFVVVRENPFDVDLSLPIVLTESERTAGGVYDSWKDITGEQYHFPNQYRKKVLPGRPFIYYKGVRRAHGRSDTPVYFGAGRIGAVWRDDDIAPETPKNKWQWFCSIEQYVPFPTPVVFKDVDDQHYEDVTHSNHFRTAVRIVSPGCFSAILSAAGMHGILGEFLDPPTPIEPEPAAQLEVNDSPLSLNRTRRRSGRIGSGGRPLSKQPKKVGDAAEKAVYNHLSKTLSPTEASTLDWPARRGETPGWDIQYTNVTGDRIAIEVKGTKAKIFSSIDISENEWKAAKDLGDEYFLYLVTDALGTQPVISPLQNPAATIERTGLEIRPVMWRIEQFGD